MRELSKRTLIVRSLQHHWRKNLSVALGVMAASAVLVGALLVGDSMRRSLTDLTLSRLGNIDELLITPRFFRADIVKNLNQDKTVASFYKGAESTIIFPQGTVEIGSVDNRRRAGSVLVVGSTEAFWKLGVEEEQPARLPQENQVVLNQALADDLNAKVGDQVTLRLPNTDIQVNADNPLGNKDDRIDSITRLEVVAIVPNRGLGRFSLFPSQTVSRNIFVNLETLRDQLGQAGKANAILVAGKERSQAAPAEGSAALKQALRPTFEDYGLKIKRVTVKQPDSEPVLDYFSLSSDQMILDDEIAEIAAKAFAKSGPQQTFTYLANSIYKPTADGQEPGADQRVVYSLATAIQSNAKLGPLVDSEGQPILLGDDEIALNDWTASQIGAKVGDTITMAYFEPETTHGEEVEKTVSLVLKAIVPITQPASKYRRSRAPKFASPPTLANDPDLTPEVRGVTDEDSIDSWETPFERTRKVERHDEDYWDYYRTTPKAFVSLATGEKLWGSRFGKLTSFRIPYEDGMTEQSLEKAFLDEVKKQEAQIGFYFAPVKRNGLRASSGATPFDGLFLALSFFIIVSALLLVSLLFRLGMEQRSSELGIMLAMGMTRKTVARTLVVEGALVAAVGSALGVLVGVGYAQLMVYGLNTWWIGAVVERFLTFHWTWTSLLIGYFSGVIISTLTIMWSIRQTRSISVVGLMNGQRTSALTQGEQSKPKWIPIAVGVCIVGALALAGMAVGHSGMQQAGEFMGGGALLLIGLLIGTWSWLRSASEKEGQASSMSLARLAISSAQRNPSRSTLTIALMSFASFLIISMSSFRLAPTEEGMGGFDWIAQSSQPIYDNLNDSEIIDELFTEQDAKLIRSGQILALRMKSGEDASCNNLYQTNQPRILGVSQEMVDYFDGEGVPAFSFQATAGETEEDRRNPWRLLSPSAPSRKGTEEDPIPVILDQNTAMYGLKKFTSVGSTDSILFEDGQEVFFKVVGLLSNSTLQGSLIIGESDFKDAFINISGYRFFLIKTAGDSAGYIEKLEGQFGDQGLDAQSSAKLLEQLLAVQNTYLSTFQSLGALGLLLGTLGLATVQLRSVLERRAELALMRASGFAKSRLGWMVLFENASLLFGGTIAGIIAALIAVLPHMVFGAASIPFGGLAGMMAVILAVGCISSLAAVLATTRAPILEALRGD